MSAKRGSRTWVRPGPVLAALLAVGCGGKDEGERPTYDLLIRDARIVDGTGNPWFRSDLGVEGGRISAVGSLQGAAHTVVDAAGRVVAPGFVDIHTHVEGRPGRSGIEQLPGADNFLRDGVTTIVTGNCGSSKLDLGAWFDRLDGLDLGVNVASLVGHNSIRSAVMGNVDRAPTAAELARMEALVERAMIEGAVGLSTGLLYLPGTFAETEEVVALARVAARYGGIYSTHLRNQAEGLEASIEEAARIGREAGLPVQLSHFKVKGRNRWGTIGSLLARIDELRSEGLDIRTDAYPYERASTSLGVNLPAWSRAGSREELQGRLREPETRARIIEEMHGLREGLGFEDYSFATVAAYAPDPSVIGRTIPEIARRRGLSGDLDSQVETILEMVSRANASMVYHYMSEGDVAEILDYPTTAVASDGGTRQPGSGQPHPRSYGTNARVLARYVRNERVLGLEDAVRRMTSLPAGILGLDGRGRIAVGQAADLVVFDPARVQDRATYENPHRYSEGFDYVIVGGRLAVAEGEVIGRAAGRALRRPH